MGGKLSCNRCWEGPPPEYGPEVSLGNGTAFISGTPLPVKRASPTAVADGIAMEAEGKPCKQVCTTTRSGEGLKPHLFECSRKPDLRRESFCGYKSDILSEKSSLISTLVHEHPIEAFHSKYDVSHSTELGSGACGVVTTVRNIDTGDDFAMKIISARDGEEMASLRTEIALHKKLDHPNIAKIIESFEDKANGRFLIIMELCTGGPLVSRMKDHRNGYNESTAATLMEKMISAVLYCHHHGVVHRDIKLDNMLFADPSEGAELKLIDFGFAHGVQPGLEIMTDQLGTPSYMAPELWRQKHTPYDSSVDMWALGAVAYMLLSGTRPFHSDDKKEKGRMIRNDPLPFHPKIWKHISAEAKDFCSSLMQKQPKDRLSASQAIRHPWLQQRSRAHSDPSVAAYVLRSNSDIMDSLQEYACSEEMKQLALEVIAFATPPQKLEKLRQVFQSMDADCSGTIDRNEFTDAMLMASNLDVVQVAHIFDSIDVNESGEIDYTEFLGATVSSCGSRMLGKSVRGAFKMLDNDGDGYITQNDLRAALKGQLSDEALGKTLKCGDSCGRVSYSAFKSVVMGARRSSTDGIVMDAAAPICTGV